MLTPLTPQDKTELRLIAEKLKASARAAGSQTFKRDLEAFHAHAPSYVVLALLDEIAAMQKEIAELRATVAAQDAQLQARWP